MIKKMKHIKKRRRNSIISVTGIMNFIKISVII